MATLRIMTFNLRRDVHADGAHRWHARRDLVAGLVAAQAPDVVGTQEGLPHQLADLDDRLPRYARVGLARDADGADEACAIYYARDRFALLDHGTLWLSDTPDQPASATWGNRHPRIVTWARLRDERTGREHTFANAHLDHESERARREAAAMLILILPHAILMGDLNATPGEPTHTFLISSGWDDGGATEPTFHGFTGRAHARLDHLLVPRRTHRIVRHAVLRHERDGVHASDHHAVVAEVEHAP